MKECSTQGTGAPRLLQVGVDVGSTTVKVAAFDAVTEELVYARYVRHQSEQVKCVAELLAELFEAFPDARFLLACSGSGGTVAAEALGVPFIQEVAANVQAIAACHPHARCAIELGGQDAKMVWLRRDVGGAVTASDMRMNGTCAGGTGAFLDEMAMVLGVDVADFDALAAKGRVVYEISGRCGVFAKTDIQPLLNRGVDKADIALSVFHAVAKQTLGGLAQGLHVEAPVVFGGGPFTFNPHLVQAFSDQLGLASGEAVVPEHSEYLVAIGAALYAGAQGAGVVPGEVAAALAAERRAPASGGTPFFASPEERAAFEARHALGAFVSPEGDIHVAPDQGHVAELPVYVGIDAGSTTTKMVLLLEDGRPLDGFYRSNGGDPLAAAQAGLIELRDRYRARGVCLKVLAAGSTGYGETMIARAFHCDSHGVETVAHARAAREYLPDVSFILDIGGQDMKAIWMQDGIITDIVMNEACSSGCGSFLENFAASLGYRVEDIAEMAFASKSPAELGSRCTVFMNSRIVSEQRAGKTREDIVAGLCASIVENAFTKVIRMTNMSRLGDAIMVQGGTFRNDAVLAAFERHVGRAVVRAPFPGHMGAIGAALIAREERAERMAAHVAEGGSGAGRSEAGHTEAAPSTFIDWDELEGFSYTRCPDFPCMKCNNHCTLSRLEFSDGSSWITGNRCPRGEQQGERANAAVPPVERRGDIHVARKPERAEAPDLFAVRERLLFKRREVARLCDDRGVRVGIPRVLQFWEDAPFWRALFESLGFTVVFSGKSSVALYESGIASVPSDTICFPAKLVHGHVRDLAKRGVDFIFMPAISMMEPEGRQASAESVCPVVKGYPFVMRNSDDPERELGVRLEAPLFHWPSAADRRRQVVEYLGRAFEVAPEDARAAVAQAEAAQAQFGEELVAAGSQVLEQVRASGGYAAVLASRPYQNDGMVNHDIPRLFTSRGIAVLTPDSLPGLQDVDLSKSRLDVANKFHERMLASAVLAARDPSLEYVQLVSFGCGHDAYLSDEILRMMREISGDIPLILKIDESPAEGSLRIRVRSFIETVRQRRKLRAETAAPGGPARASAPAPRPLSDPYPVKFTKADAKAKTILIPNTSHAFTRLMATVFAKQGVHAVALDLGGEEAIRLGKQYVHNDICFPAQMVVGEILAALESGRYDVGNTAVGMAKYIGDCRLTHYSALLRKALDDAGFANVPIVTNDLDDDHDLHPGFSMSLASMVYTAFGLPMIDALEELLRKIRPYELEPGSADAAFDRALDAMLDGLATGGVAGLRRGFAESIRIMGEVAYDRSRPRPRVLIVGEYLLNFHAGANRHVERYLEDNGFEIIEARMTDVIRKSYYSRHRQNADYRLRRPLKTRAIMAGSDDFFEVAHDVCDRIASAHPLYEKPCRLPELAMLTDDVIQHTFDAGEGVLIPAEIAHHAERGCRAFVILGPFGCLPNHIVGRGVARRLKERYPDAQILSLDYDPDSSFANVENRLQMLVAGVFSAPSTQPCAESAIQP